MNGSAFGSSGGMDCGLVVNETWAGAALNLTEWQRASLSNSSCPERECYLYAWSLPTPTGPYCNATWDTYYCWPNTPANANVYRPCPNLHELPVDATGIFAHRRCNEHGRWQDGAWTNYSSCVVYMLARRAMMREEQRKAALELKESTLLGHVFFIATLISLLCLVITLFIFCYFKALQCSRISIHKNLVVSYICRCSIVLVMVEPIVSGRLSSFRNIDWLCKVITALLQYSIMANILWMLVEGFFLHNRVAVSVFDTQAPFRLFYFIGWGLPGIFTVTWGIVMHFYHDARCWNDYSQVPYHKWIIVAPITVALSINLLFLINIIRILVTKLRANNTLETDQIRKAIKATAVLFPLLGATNLLFFIPPKGELEFAYRIANAVLQSSQTPATNMLLGYADVHQQRYPTQGTLVSIIYCFCNAEVRGAILKKWRRYRMRRMGGSRGRRRSSRTSSLYLSQVEVEYGITLMSSRKRAAGGADDGGRHVLKIDGRKTGKVRN